LGTAEAWETVEYVHFPFDSKLYRRFPRYPGASKLTHAAVFDNWRVLHGRSAFTGKRRMAGGYSMCFLPCIPPHTNFGQSIAMIMCPGTSTPTSQESSFWPSTCRLTVGFTLSINIADARISHESYTCISISYSQSCIHSLVPHCYHGCR
jgi:hypothetical protein